MTQGAWTYVLFFAILFAFGLVLNYLLLKFLKSPGTKNQQGEILVRWSAQAKPTMGGIGFFVLFLITIVFTLFDAQSVYVADELMTIVYSTTAACSLAFIAGFYDDAFNTKPLVKLLSQIVCAAILMSGGIVIELFDSQVPNYVLTALWIVGLMNSLNMLDNMDGITTLVACSIVVWYIISLFVTSSYSPFVPICLGVLGSFLAFLRFNWNPSKMFMGDSGSQFVGVFLASISIIGTWNIPYEMVYDYQFSYNPLVAALLFLIPLTDTTIVTINRLSHNRSPMVGGRDHTTHNLVYCGLTDRQVALTYTALSLINITLVFLITFKLKDIGLWIIWLAVAYMLAVFFTLFVISRRNLSRGKYSYS